MTIGSDICDPHTEGSLAARRAAAPSLLRSMLYGFILHLAVRATGMSQCCCSACYHTSDQAAGLHRGGV